MVSLLLIDYKHSPLHLILGWECGHVTALGLGFRVHGVFEKNWEIQHRQSVGFSSRVIVRAVERRMERTWKMSNNLYAGIYGIVRSECRDLHTEQRFVVN